MASPTSLQLGDIVQVSAPSRRDLNGKHFLIEYLGSGTLVLRGENGKDIALAFTAAGTFRSRAIKGVRVVDRAAEKGYARQRGLVPGVWAEFYFGGPDPEKITAQVVSLDEDMIGVETWPDEETLYIDFGYAGVPPALDLEDIMVLDSPPGPSPTPAGTEPPPVEAPQTPPRPDTPETQLTPRPDTLDTPPRPDMPEASPRPDTPETPLTPSIAVLGAPEEETAPSIEELRDIELSAGDIVFGKALGDVTQDVEVPDSQRRYPLEAQINDLLDDMLAQLPPSERTPQRLRNLHTMLERFGELRQQFSELDALGYPAGPLRRTASHRPLVDAIANLADLPSWVVPIARNTKKVYNIDGEPPYGDVEVLDLAQQLSAETEARESVDYGERLPDAPPAAVVAMRRTAPFADQVMAPASTEVLGLISCTASGQCAVNNLGQQTSSVVTDDILTRRRLATTSYLTGEQGLAAVPHAPGQPAYATAIVTPNDEVGLVGLVYLPTSALPCAAAEQPGSLLIDGVGQSHPYGLVGPRADTELTTVDAWDAKIPDKVLKKQAHLLELDDDLYADEDRLAKFLSAVTPTTEEAIETLNHDGQFARRLDYNSLISPLRAFLVYGDDITYRQHDVLAKKLRNNVRSYVRRIASKRGAYKRYAGIRNTAFAAYREPFGLPPSLRTAYHVFERTLPMVVVARALAADGASTLAAYLGEARPQVYSYGERPEQALLEAYDAAQVAVETAPSDCAGQYSSEMDLEGEEGAAPGDAASLCNAAESCLYIDRTCTSEAAVAGEAEEKTLGGMVRAFELAAEANARGALIVGSALLAAADKRLVANLALARSGLQQDEAALIAIAAKARIPETPPSPYSGLLGAILAQDDFAKKQADVLRFSAEYTVPGPTEWTRLCRETDTPLLPTFYVKLATAFTRGDYQSELDEICRVQGTLSDSGDTWVDKYTGSVIRSLQFASNEGFDETGYLIAARDALQSDAGEVVSAAVQGDKESIRIAAMASGISKQLHVSIETHIPYIVDAVKRLVPTLVPAKAAYAKKEAQAKQKQRKLPAYDFVVNNVQLLCTLSATFVAIQTAVPALKVGRGFPGCVKSFTGFPLQGTEDTSGMRYIACVAAKMRSSASPWDTIRKLDSDQLLKKLLAVTQKLADDATTKDRIATKLEFLRDAPPEVDDVPAEHDPMRWLSFLPPLTTPQVIPVRPVPSAFMKRLSQELVASSAPLALLLSRASLMSFGIQEALQSVVSGTAPILATADGTAFVENACCSDGAESAAAFYASSNPIVTEYNSHAASYMRDFYRYAYLSRAPSYRDLQDTRVVYPPVHSTPSQPVIYLVFAHYCAYNKLAGVSPDMEALCQARSGPPIERLDPAETVEAMQRAGASYSLADYLQLMRKVAAGTTTMLLLPEPVPPTAALRKTLEGLSPGGVVPGEVSAAFETDLDMFGVAAGDTNAARNALLAQSDVLRARLKMFVRTYGTKSLSAAQQEFLDDLRHWGGQPTRAAANIKAFTAGALLSAGRFYPEAVVRSMLYDQAKVPRNWGLSERHVDDVKRFVGAELAPLRAFYKRPLVNEVCRRVIRASGPLIGLQHAVPLIVPKGGGESVFGAALTADLGEYSVLRALVLYIESAEAVATTAGTMGTPPEETTLEADVAAALALETNPVEVQHTTADLLSAIISMLQRTRKAVAVSVEEVAERTLRAREKEKDEITGFLEGLTDEEREAQNVLKNNRLGSWGKGKTRGLVSYVQGVYDDEVAALEQRAMMDQRLGEISEVTAMNRDLYALDVERETLAAAGIDAEVDDLGMLADDDDYGDGDGDEAY
jgi:hypothetical protein